MQRLTISRRTCLSAIATTAACGGALTSSGDSGAAVEQSEAARSRSGIVYRPDIHKTDFMKGSPPPKDKRVTIHNWHRDIDTVRYMHLHEDRIFRTTGIFPDHSRLWSLPRRTIDFGKLAHSRVLWGPTEEKARSITVAEWLELSQTDAFIVIHDGHIVAEQYFGEMTPDTRHSVWSSSKSVIAVLMAGLLAGGKLHEQDLVTKHIPELGASAFGKATFRQVFDQTTGVELKTFPGPRELEGMSAAERKAYDFGSREHRQASNDNARLLRAIGCFPSLPNEENSGMYDFIHTFVKTRQHGACFYYADANPITA